MSEIQEEEIDLREYINVLLKEKVLLFNLSNRGHHRRPGKLLYLKPVYEASTILMIPNLNTR